MPMGHTSVVSADGGGSHIFLQFSSLRPSLPHFCARRPLDDIDTVVLRCCLDGLSDVIDSTASAEDREVVVRRIGVNMKTGS